MGGTATLGGRQSEGLGLVRDQAARLTAYTDYADDPLSSISAKAIAPLGCGAGRSQSEHERFLGPLRALGNASLLQQTIGEIATAAITSQLP